MELERQNDVERLGKWPFEIGLWVGQAATPNKMGFKGDRDPNSARSRTIAFQNDDRRSHLRSRWRTVPGAARSSQGTRSVSSRIRMNRTDLRIVCVNRRCQFTGDNPLPILAVDEPIYRRLPCFLIATVDKFAGLPWVGQ